MFNPSNILICHAIQIIAISYDKSTYVPLMIILHMSLQWSIRLYDYGSVHIFGIDIIVIVGCTPDNLE